MQGLDLSHPPQVSAYRTTLREGATVLLRAGDYAALAVQPVGRGRVYSFPVCLSPNSLMAYEIEEPEWLGNEPNGERERSLFLWDQYVNLWRRLALAAQQGDQAPAVRDFAAERDRQGQSLRLSFRGEGLPAGARAEVSASQEGRPLATRSVADPGRLSTVAWEGLSPYLPVQYCVTLRQGSRELTRQDGTVLPTQEPPFRLVVGDFEGLCTVFRREHAVPWHAELAGDGTEPLRLALVDPWGQTVWEQAVAASPAQAQGTLPLMDLAFGDYTLVATRGEYQQRRTLTVAADLDDQDRFYITTLDWVVDFTDDPADQAEFLTGAREGGLNLIRDASDCWDEHQDLLRFPGRYRRQFGDAILRAGLVPAHYDVFVAGAGGSRLPHQTEDELRQETEKSLGRLSRVWDMAPRGVLTYIYDEPYHYDAIPNCPICRAEYVRRYGAEPPADKSQPGFYRLAQIMDQAMVDGVRRKGEMWWQLDTEHRLHPWALTNEGMGQMESALALARTFGGYGVDMFTSSPGNWGAQYSFDMALAAADYDPQDLGFQIEANSVYGGTPIAAQRGHGAYSILARGAKLMQWFDWQYARNQAQVGVLPERFACVTRASNEALQIGPVLRGLQRPRGPVAMLVPWAVRAVGSGNALVLDEEGLCLAYRAAQVACGHVDFLHYQHLREGKLNDYKVMLLAGNDWLDEEMESIIAQWVAQGGTLIVAPRSGQLTGNLEAGGRRWYGTGEPPAAPLVTWGERRAEGLVEGLAGDSAQAWALQGEAGEVAYRYADGQPAARRWPLGQGRVLLLGFVPSDGAAFARMLQDLGADSWVTRSDDPDASAWLLQSGAAYYAVVVNSENKAKTVSVALRTDLQQRPWVVDMLTGQPVEAQWQPDGQVTLSVALEAFWGRAIALLPQEPAQLAVTTRSSVAAGSAQSYSVSLCDESGQPLGGRAPVELTVTDASGRERPEYGGYHVLQEGRLRRAVALGRNNPAGMWTITARQPWTGLTGRGEFAVTR